jgi:hypothetical protein
LLNGKNLIDELKYEDEIEELTNRQLAEFNARALFRMSNNCAVQDGRIKDLENGDKKRGTLSGGIISSIIVAIYAIYNQLTKGG